MKVIAFHGSARKNGNTSILINTVLQELQDNDIADDHSRLELLENGHRTGQGRCGAGC
jgi:multimeric flavodoxin WrbA